MKVLKTIMWALSGALMTTGIALAAPVDQAQSGVNKVGGTDEGNNDLLGTVRTIINVILGVVGVLAVFMMIVGGINMATSQGDPAKVKKGRDTLLYGVIGLVVALLAFAIVNFVLKNVFG